MPDHTIISLLRSSAGAGACLLLALFLGLQLNGHGPILIENEEIFTSESPKRPETTTPQGTVRGVNMATHHNRTIFSFLGIPFAQPPVGNLRFRAPVPATVWNGTLDASSASESCPQFHKGKVIGNEDCLYLNVYTPKLPANENSTLLPVMLYIIGGSFNTGISTPAQYGPDFLLDKDVVLVIPNFRLGPLGFLSTGDEVSPGNYGLKDMVQALQWNQDNIRHFGGDPNQVTLFGASSGAISVHLLSLSDSTNGLFHRCITQSGAALTLFLEEPREVHTNRATQLGEYFGCPTNTSTLLVECLRSFSASQLIDTPSLFYEWRRLPTFIWSPTSEPDIEGALLIDRPANLFATGKVRGLPWLSSVTSDEGLVYSLFFYENPDAVDQFLDEIDVVLPYMLKYANSVENVTAYTAALKSYYLNDLTVDRSLLLHNLTQLIGDTVIIYPVYTEAQKRLVLSESPQYFASFEYRGVFGYSYFFSGGSTKYKNATHGEELIYLFQNHNHPFGPPHYQYSDADWVMVDTMVQLWTSFATNGTPNTANLSSNINWEPYSSSKKYLRIGKESDLALEMKCDLLKERMEFWDELTAATTWK